MASFSGNIWNFFKAYPEVTVGGEKGPMGLTWISVPGPFFDVLVRARWKKSHPEIETTKFSGQSLRADWLEQTYLMPSLFDTPKILEIYQAQDISADAKEMLAQLSQNADFPGALLVADASSPGRKKKTSPSAKGKKIEQTPLHLMLEATITEYKFWEMDDFVSQLAREWKLSLNSDQLHAVLEESGGEIELIFALLRSMTQLPEGDVKYLSCEEIKLFKQGQNLDKFQIASWWGEKKWKELEKFLGKETLPIGEERALIAFIRSHILKFPDIWDGFAPAPTNQYQRGLFQQAKKWKIEEWEQEIFHLGAMEILAKQKSPLLWSSLRQRSLVS